MVKHEKMTMTYKYTFVKAAWQFIYWREYVNKVLN